MEMKDFLEKLKECRGYKNIDASKLEAYYKGDKVRLVYFGRIPAVVDVQFTTARPLSVFEAKLLVALYGFGRRLPNYANYHKCVGGQKFIKNIIKAEVV